MALPLLRVAAGRRSLETVDGRPFFWLGDTAWELFHRCTRDEADLLLRDRAAKGFNVVQAVALAELGGLREPNTQGHTPFLGDDPARPVEAYWEQVDWIVRRANELGLYVGFLPTWGDKWNKGVWGLGPEIFNPANAREYGRWLGARYRDDALVWILGGDRALRDERDAATIRAMAEGLTEGDGGVHLRTFHPPGGRSSSAFVHCEAWLDFHMVQTGHDRDRVTWAIVERDWEMLPVRPVINGEPCYEAHPNAFRGGDSGWLDQADVRRELYWTICAGGAGFTYGCHAIWQMWDGVRPPINSPRATWKESLHLPGASQVRHALRLLGSRPFATREPASWLVQWPQPVGPDAIRACWGSDAEGWVMVYTPNCQRVKLDVSPFTRAGRRLRTSFFNPRTGTTVPGENLDPNAHEAWIQPPFDPEGRDWVILVDDVERGYSAP